MLFFIYTLAGRCASFELDARGAAVLHQLGVALNKQLGTKDEWMFLTAGQELTATNTPSALKAKLLAVPRPVPLSRQTH